MIILVLFTSWDSKWQVCCLSSSLYSTCSCHRSLAPAPVHSPAVLLFLQLHMRPALSFTPA